jgi:hypothetical protein
VAERDWHVSPNNPGRIGAAGVVNAFLRINRPELVELLEHYAEAAEIVARADLSAVAGQGDDVSGMAETVVAGTVLGDAMFAALRRMAQEHVTSQLYPFPGAHADPAGPSHGTPAAHADPAVSTHGAPDADPA